MKKRISVLVTLIIVTLLGIIIILNNKNKTFEITNDNDGQFAFYYEDENGEYQRSTDSKWDSGNYILNLENTTCDGESNPSFLSWNNDNNSVTLTRNKATKCTLYFDIKTYDKVCNDNSFACYIAKKKGTQVGDNNEELIYHNGLIDVDNNGVYDDAGDLSYRYSGDNPDNFVCFGSNQSPCPVENLYRIIGVFPMIKEDGSVEYQVKLIKSEYITQGELGLKRDRVDDPALESDGMENIAYRVQNSSGADCFAWMGTNQNNNWKISPINIALNSTYYDNFSSKWQNMIANSDWIIGGVDYYLTSSVKTFYNHELGSDRIQVGDQKCVDGNSTEIVKCTADMLETKAKIGLMYVSDYLYSSGKNNWGLGPQNGYKSFDNRANNWLYNGFYEYTISRSTGETDTIYNIDCFGYVYKWIKTQAIRPTFYLSTNVQYLKGSGTFSDPYQIKEKAIDYSINEFDEVCSNNSLACYIANKQGTQTGDKVGEELLYHNNTIDVNADGIPDDAGDLSYRYSGDNPDNFVCFGTNQSPCPVGNLYRILGVFLVENEDGSKDYKVKLIKSEYITQDELGLARYNTKNMGTNEHEMVSSITPRVKKITGVDTFLWTNTADHLNNWNLSPIKEKLNNTTDGYLSHLDTTWQNMISKNNWYIGGVKATGNNSRENYGYELGNNKVKENDVLCINNTTTLVPCTKTLLEAEAKVGLMYATDYLFSSEKSNWNLASYHVLSNRENNWLYNGFYEYFITRVAGTSNNLIDLDIWGYIAINSRSYGESVRPVFYLNSDVKYISGYGTELEPYIIG